MRRVRFGFVLCLCFLAWPACEKAPPQAQRRAAASVSPPSAPSGVLLSAQLPSPNAQLRGLADLANQIQPGAGFMLGTTMLETSLAELLGLPHLQGVNFDKPLFVLMLNPKVHPKPFVLVVTVKDAQALQKSVSAAQGGVAVRTKPGFAALGTQTALDDVGTYALGALLEETPAKVPTITVRINTLLSAFHDEIEQFRQQFAAAAMIGNGPVNMQKFISAELDAFMAFAEQTERAWLSVDASAQGGTLEFGFAPQAGSTAAAVIAAQRPSSYPLIAKLPQVAEGIVMAGHFELGPLHARMVPLMAWMFSEIMHTKLDPRLLKDTGAWLDLLTGEYAGLITYASGAGIGAMQLVGITNAAKAQKLFQTLMARWAKTDIFAGLGLKSKISYKLKAWKHKDVTVSEQRMTVDLGSLPEAERATMESWGVNSPSYFANYDTYFEMTTGPAAKESMRKAIEASRGTGALIPSPALTQALETSRQLGESALVFVDVLTLMAKPAGNTSGISVGLGFAGGNATLRIHVPSDHVKSLRSLM
jgi:hypothetical protein